MDNFSVSSLSEIKNISFIVDIQTVYWANRTVRFLSCKSSCNSEVIKDGEQSVCCKTDLCNNPKNVPPPAPPLLKCYNCDDASQSKCSSPKEETCYIGVKFCSVSIFMRVTKCNKTIDKCT